MKGTHVGRVALQRLADMGDLAQRLPPVQKGATSEYLDRSRLFDSDVKRIAEIVAGCSTITWNSTEQYDLCDITPTTDCGQHAYCVQIGSADDSGTTPTQTYHN